MDVQNEYKVGTKVCVSLKEIYEKIGSDLCYDGTIEHTEDDDEDYYDLWIGGVCCMDGEEYNVIHINEKENIIKLEHQENGVALYLTKEEFDVAVFSEVSFEDVRTKCIRFDNQRNIILINEWCEKAGIELPVGFSNDVSNHTMTIYTNWAERYIGRRV